MVKIIKTEINQLPEVFVVGKKITVKMPNKPEINPIPALWDTCFSDNTFDYLMKYRDLLFNDAYVGWMSDFSSDNGTFTYICGMLMKSDNLSLDDGFVSRKIEPVTVGIGWIQGSTVPEICFAAHSLVEKAVQEKGYSCNHATWCMEVYNCPRFTQPDENGEIILDYYVPCIKNS